MINNVGTIKYELVGLLWEANVGLWVYLVLQDSDDTSGHRQHSTNSFTEIRNPTTLNPYRPIICIFVLSKDGIKFYQILSSSISESLFPYY